MIIWSGCSAVRLSHALLSLRGARLSTVPRTDGRLEVRFLNPIVSKMATCGAQRPRAVPL